MLTLMSSATESSSTSTQQVASASVLAPNELEKMNAYGRGANYFSVGQIYLYDNPLLREPLEAEHIKPRLLGHWGTTPGLNSIYVHFNRLIKKYDLNVIYVAGPGHGGPGLVANTYLEGSYSEFYPNIPQNANGIRRLFSWGAHFKQLLRNKLIEHKQYIARYSDDMPEIRDWKWPY